MEKNPSKIYGTTVLCVKKCEDVVIAADGQVSFGNTILKSTASKIRDLNSGKIVVGFAGSTADALTLFERLEQKLDNYSNNLSRSAVELAKDWRADKYLRKLEAMLLVADKNNMFLVTGMGDVIEPEYDAIAIGSGAPFALSAARALLESGSNLNAEEIVQKAMEIAGDICIYSNKNIKIQKVK